MKTRGGTDRQPDACFSLDLQPDADRGPLAEQPSREGVVQRHREAAVAWLLRSRPHRSAVASALVTQAVLPTGWEALPTYLGAVVARG